MDSCFRRNDRRKCGNDRKGSGNDRTEKIEIATVVSLLRNDRIDRRDACPTGDMRLPRFLHSLARREKDGFLLSQE
jgi:hypothetical protein